MTFVLVLISRVSDKEGICFVWYMTLEFSSTALCKMLICENTQALMQDRTSTGNKCWPYVHPSVSPRHCYQSHPSCQQPLYSYIKLPIWDCIYVGRANTRQSIVFRDDKQWQRTTQRHGDCSHHSGRKRTKLLKSCYVGSFIHPTGVIYSSVGRAMP